MAKGMLLTSRKLTTCSCSGNVRGSIGQKNVRSGDSGSRHHASASRGMDFVHLLVYYLFDAESNEEIKRR